MNSLGKSKIAAITIVAILAASILMPGCIPFEDMPLGSCDLPPFPTLGPGPTATTRPTPTSKPVAGGTLNLYDTGPITLDPALSAETSSHMYVTHIFSGLMALNSELRPVPDLAERYEKSPDGKTYTFYLRKGARFHNGREVKAGDVKYSWERACNPQLRSITAGTYLGDIVGVSDMLTGRAKELAGVKVVDDYTFQVTIDAPKEYFLSKMTYPTAYVVARENVATGGEWWRKPIGTGPFKLSEWQEDSLVVLVRNETYYGQPVTLGSAVFNLYGGIPFALYETGQIDVSPVYQSEVERARDKAGPFYSQLTEQPELSLQYIGFNATKPPFDDPNVRKAFTIAIDRQKIIDLTLSGTVRRADGILPPGMPGYSIDIKGLTYNIAEAKRLLAASKYSANMPPITLTTTGYGNNVPDYIGAMVQQWRENLGIEVTIRQLEPEIFLYRSRQEKDEMYASGWIADYPDPQDFLDLLFRTGAENNVGEYSNREIDVALDRAAVDPNQATRFKSYQEIEQKLVDDAACIPMWFGVNYLLTKPYVKGYRMTPLGLPAMSLVTIQPH
jgi:oligopeptide transport system substrate-binding protein